MRTPILASRMIRPYLSGVGMLTSTNETDFSTSNYTGWTNPNVTFVRGRFTWGHFETAEGVFDWDSTDSLSSMCATYGKKWSANFGAGLDTLQWVYDAGAIKYACHNEPGQFQPLPWDTVYQTKYFAFLDQVAARYAKDPNFCLLWATGFMQAGDMLIGDATDETTMPHTGYADVDAAYVAGAESVIAHTMTAFPSQNVLVNFKAPFPTPSGITAGATVKNYLISTWPKRGGAGVSAIFAVQGFGPPAKATQDSHGFPKGGQQVQPTVIANVTNPNCYQTPPVPLPAPPDPFLDMGGNARELGNTFLETYQSDLKNLLVQSVMASENAAYKANLP